MAGCMFLSADIDGVEFGTEPRDGLAKEAEREREGERENAGEKEGERMWGYDCMAV